MVFLDRDGVINADIGYLWRQEDCMWIPGAPEAIRLFNDKGWPVAVVTNQSGVARGYYRETDVQALHAWMKTALAVACGAHIDAFYYCPHHIKGLIPEYAVDCECRKPKPGMIKQGLKDFGADPEACLLIGDNLSDVAAAEAAGIRGFLFPGGNLRDFVVNNVLPEME